MVFLNAPQTADVILAFKLSSHYPLGSHDYTRIDFSCNFKKTNVKFLERKLNWRGRANPFSVWSVAGNSKRVSLNPKRGHHLKLRMLFEWAKEPLSHYPLGSHDYTRIDFSCNILKYECEVLREDTELKGDVHPIQYLINAWEWVPWTQLMHLKLRMFFSFRWANG